MQHMEIHRASSFLSGATTCRPALAAVGQLTGALCQLSTSTQPGLFGNPRLQSPSDYVQWAAEVEQRCHGLIQQVLQAPRNSQVIQLLDDMSNEMCQVYDSAECCRNVHAGEAWRNAASDACQHMGTFVAEVNQHRGIYQKLKDTLQRWAATSAAAATGQQHAASDGQKQAELLSPSEYQQFTPEAVIVGQKLLLDFEKSGIHLTDPEQREAVQELMARNGHYGALFNHALADMGQLGTAQIPADLLPAEWGRQVSSWRQGRTGAAGRQYTLTLDSPTLHHFLSTVPSEEARRQAYVAGHNTPEGNLQLLDEMLSCRAQLAHLLGFSSYVHFKAAESTLARVPQAAAGFLRGLSAELRPLADAEAEQLRAMKARDTGNSAARLFAWDQDYYIVKAKSQLKDQQYAREAAAPYLHLGSVLKGLSELLQQLMGLRLVPEPFDSREAWGPGVTKLRVESEEQGVMGTLYIDIGRHGKTAGSVLYPVVCGRQCPDGSYQNPVLVLVTSCSGGSGASGGPVLTWRELRTLLHEMGHAVHNLVSRTHYQHLWGTRCAQDIVEVPSHLWEHFVADPRSLALLARHARTGEPMPEGLLQQLEAVQHLFPALELQQQVLLSLLDLTYHGPPRPQPQNTSELWAELASEHSSIPYVQGTSPQARFNHLTIYGASYYTYLFARCLSSSIWEQHLQQDPLSHAAGERIRSKLLAPGGTVEPLPLLQGALGDGAWQKQLQQWPEGGWSPCYDALLHKAEYQHIDMSV